MDHQNSPSVQEVIKALSGIQDRIQSAHQVLLSCPEQPDLPLKNFLRATSGKLHTALMLVDDLKNLHDSIGGTKPPAWTADLAHVQICARALSSWQASTEAHAAELLRALQVLCVHLDLAQQAQSFFALVKCLSIQFREHPSPSSLPEQAPPTQQDSIKSLKQIEASLDLILSTDFDQKVGCFYDYRQLVTRRKTNYPSYSKDSITWVGYAEQYWGQLGGRILRLFDMRKSPNFQHWFLEYCQQTWPEIYRLEANTNPEKPVLGLLSTITESPVTPLHVAAALGLAHVCEYLISQGADQNLRSPLGTPFYCALVGPMALWARKAEPLITVQWPCASIAHMDTLSHFQDNRCWAEPEPDTEHALLSLPSLIFLVCLRLGSTDLYQRFFSAHHIDSCLDAVVEAASTALPWGNPESERARRFLSTSLPYIFDALLPAFEGVTASEVLNGLWDVMTEMELEMTMGKSKSTVSQVADADFTDVARRALRHYEEPVVLRLIQDPRWDPDSIQTSEGSPILHSLVVDDSIDMIKAIVDSGADIHIRDDEGQTPVMRSESVSTLEYLVNHGARLNDVDNHGQNIWHICAANSDRGMLEWLILHDEHMATNLSGCMRGGRTPAAQAMIHALHELTKVDPEGPSDFWGEALNHRAIFCLSKLLSFCKSTPSHLRASDRSLIHVAAEWGLTEAMNACLQSGSVKMNVLDAEGNSALHCINFGVEPEAICFLQQHCSEVPIQNHQGHTPAETIFFNFDKAFTTLSMNSGLSSHPACRTHLEVESYLLLLTPRVLASKDAAGRGLWERFIVDVVLGWSTGVEPGRRANLRAFPSMLCAAACLVAKGALASWWKGAAGGADPLLGLKDSDAWKHDRYWTTCVERIEEEVIKSGVCSGNGRKRSRSTSDMDHDESEVWNEGERPRTARNGPNRSGPELPDDLEVATTSRGGRQ